MMQQDKERVNSGAGDNDPPAGDPARELVLVLGMHRSGTSAITGLLGLLGFELGDDLLAPQADNPKGFFENVNVVAIHDRLLRALGGSWHAPRPLPDDWIHSDAASLAMRELRAITKDLFVRSPRVVLKDPRACRVAPLWLDIARQEAWTPKVIVVVRHPDEVARSLQRRDGMSPIRAKLLWLQHLLDAEVATRGVDRVFIAYDALLTDWRKQMARLCERLGLAVSLDDPDTGAKVDAFLSVSLPNHVQPGEDLSPPDRISRIVLDAYSLAMRCSNDEVEDVGAAFNDLDADVATIAEIYLGAVEDTLALDLPTRLQAEKDALQIDQGKVELARQTSALVEFLRPKSADIATGGCKIYYRDEDAGYGEDRAVCMQPERDGREFTVRLAIPAGEHADFLRIDPDEMAGVFSLLEVEVGGLAHGVLRDRVTTASEQLLPAPPDALLMLSAVGNDPYVEFDLRGLSFENVSQPLEVRIRYRRETLATEMESQIARSIDQRTGQLSASIDYHFLELQGTVTQAQQNTLSELRSLADSLQAHATHLEQMEADQQAVRHLLERRSFSYWWRRLRG